MERRELLTELGFIRYQLDRMMERRLLAPFSRSERALFHELSAREQELLRAGHARSEFWSTAPLTLSAL